MFLVPSGTAAGGRLLDWSSALKVPWGVFIMIGGGMAVGQAFGVSGLGQALGDNLAPLTRLPLWAMMASVCVFATFLTEVTSNTAVANMLMPVLASAGVAAGIDPALLMVPATLGLNWAFMLPVAGAANALVFGTGRIRVSQMAREGFALNVIGAVVVTATCLWLLG